MIYGRLHPQDTALLVINLDRVPINRMAQANSLRTTFERAGHFALETLRLGLAQKPEHALAAKTASGVVQKLRVKLGQAGRVLKHEIRGVFGLGCAPVVLLVKRPLQFSVQRMRLGQQATQRRIPISMQLLVQQLLCARRIGHRE